jgi:hypothetical protein
LTHVNCKLLISDNVATANRVSFRKKLEQFSAQSGKAWLEVKTSVRCPSRASRSDLGHMKANVTNVTNPK